MDIPLLLPREVFDAIVDDAATRALERLDKRRVDARSPYMTVNEAADYLRWPVQRIYKLTAARAIPHRRHQGRILFRRDEVDAWLDVFSCGRTSSYSDTGTSRFHAVSRRADGRVDS